jgi:hypothetical protein
MLLYNLWPKKRIYKTIDYKRVTIDISMISATRFAFNYQDPSATLFLITLKEIDYKI